MRARAVIGANFGDCGKGLIVDWLCATQGAGMVVRFNGGAQAGHTVVTPDGKRHVFSHFGSGTFCGVPTFLSQFFICNPILFLKEAKELSVLGLAPVVYVHPSCAVTTFADMIINQRVEDSMGEKRHGSCGVGISETVSRSQIPHLQITMADLWNGISLDSKLSEICGKYAEFRTGKPIEKPEAMIAEFGRRCETFAAMVHPLGIGQCKEPVFEGAQGLLLDQNNKQFFPHVTRSNTGMTNVRKLCAQAGITGIDPYYVSRTYLTRHGAGFLPGEDKRMSFHDETNVSHPYQGSLRFAPLDKDLLARCDADAGKHDWHLVLTHCDQLKPSLTSQVVSYGPTRNDIQRRPKCGARPNYSFGLSYLERRPAHTGPTTTLTNPWSAL
jgi:adenylosuccinate synthase